MQPLRAERNGLRAAMPAVLRIAVACVLTAVGIALGACRSPSVESTGEILGPSNLDLGVAVDGSERSYWLHVPPRPAGTAPAPLPLVIAFHGGGGRAEQYQRYAGLDFVADRERFVVAYPDGTGRLGRRMLTWNAGACCGAAHRGGADDVAFARALVDDIAIRTPIDRTRVYATGHSNGAMMSYRIAVEAPDLVAAIAPVGGAMNLPGAVLSVPMPVLHIHSVDDPRALYAGGLGPPFPMTRNRVLHNGVEAELDKWISTDGCNAEPTTREERTDQATGHTATHLSWAPCASGATVELWKITGAGHGWPGGAAPLPERLVGPDTHVISASEEIWKFFSRFPAVPES
jgi:polyhydroxybutyrate depolymerase